MSNSDGLCEIIALTLEVILKSILFCPIIFLFFHFGVLKQSFTVQEIKSLVEMLKVLHYPLSVQDEDLQEMRQSAVQIDQQYGHLVDRVLIKEDSASACAELRGILENLERESFWVPVCWVRP